jgi:hypothetical protein
MKRTPLLPIIAAFVMMLVIIGCKKNKVDEDTTQAPTVTTNDVTNITTTSATCGGNVTDDGGLEVTARGVCWSTSQNPTVIDACTVDGSGIGAYTTTLTGLRVNTVYYVRAYARNSVGISYGEELSLKTEIPTPPVGAINGVFAISDTEQVFFSHGNLQYQASTNTWRLAGNQWDYIGNDNANISSNYSGWIDLFGWGTSGYNHGAVCYQPWGKSETNSDYYAYGNSTCNLNDQTGQADWGYNAITNGGNTTNTWRTLTNEEWEYVFNTRSTASGIRYAKAQVNGVNGVILIPDDWSSSNCSLSNTNTPGASYSSNGFSQAGWTDLFEDYGAVFLPAAGFRYGPFVNFVGSSGCYWSASYDDSYDAHDVFFTDEYLFPGRWGRRRDGQGVRLVCSAE